jgi:SAM-dependent methyltransferase
MAQNQLTWEQAVLWLREQPEQQALVRSCYFDAPLDEAVDRYYRDPEWRAVRALLPKPPGRALDVGAGMGISSYALARDGWDVTALEPDPSGVVGAGAIRAVFAAKGLPVRIEQTWGEKLPFPDNYFRVVHCRQVLHHARDLPQLGRELGRVLMPGGTFIATREHVLVRKEDLPLFQAAHPLHRLYGGENAFLLREYLSALRGGGIRVARQLNPFASEINLFPETKDGLKKRIARRLRFPWPGLIPDFALELLGRRKKDPGMLYTFVGTKP